MQSSKLDLLKLLKPGDNTLHIIIDGLLNVIKHGLIWRERAFTLLVELLSSVHSKLMTDPIVGH